MNWLDYLEQKRTLLIGGVITICVAMLAVTARRDPVSYDVFWHLQTGLDWLRQGLSPWIDHYTFTAQGQPINGQPFLFQAVIALLVEQFGLEPGLQIFKFASFIAVLGIFILFLKKLRSPVVIYLLVLPLLVVLIQMRAIARPELISYSFSIIAVMLYYRAQGRVTTKNLLPIMLLMLVWSNYHTSILGYVIFFGFFVDAALLLLQDKATIRKWGKWFTWGIAVVGVGFLNPSFTHSLIGAFSFAPEWKDFIQEYAPSTVRYRNNLPIYGLFIIAMATLALATGKKKIGYLMVTGVLLYNALQVSRLVTPAGIIILCIFASLISEVDFSRMATSLGKTANRFIAGSILLIFLVSLYYGVVISRAYVQENRIAAHKYPESLVNYLKEQQFRGRIFNDYEMGGYLIYYLTPDSQVYIDGRTNILHPLEHYSYHIKARNNPVEMNRVLEKYDIDVAILKGDHRAYSVTHNTGTLKLDFVDKKYALFVRHDANFPVSGELLAYPACWNPELIQPLETEQAKAIWKLPPNSGLLPWLDSVLSFANSDDPVQFLVDLDNPTLRQIHIAKFAAYQALNNGMYQESINFLSRYGTWDLGDFIAAAIAYTRLGHWDKAEQLLDGATQIPWPNVTPGQTLLLYRILRVMQQHSKLTLISEDYIKTLEKNVIGMSESPDNLEMDFDLFCNR